MLQMQKCNYWVKRSTILILLMGVRVEVEQVIHLSLFSWSVQSILFLSSIDDVFFVLVKYSRPSPYLVLGFMDFGGRWKHQKIAQNGIKPKQKRYGYDECRVYTRVYGR